MHTRRIARSDLPSIVHFPWVDTSHRPYIKGDIAYVPVREGYDYEHDLSQKKRYCGRGYQKIGDVVAFHGPKPSQAEITSVIIHEHPRGIVWIKKSNGTMRIPEVEHLFGTSGEVIHNESGLSYCLDVDKVMFSQGNREEKNRISSLVTPGEQIADMFAGIGYFTLPIARAGGYVHAIELNPVSFQYLLTNVQLNKVENRVHPVQGNCHDNLDGVYNRIIMGHFDSWNYILKALSHVTQGSVLHIHGIDTQEKKIIEILDNNCYSYYISSHFVKSIGPRTRHMVWDITISEM